MITFFRKALTSWFALALLGLVVIAFAVTGIGDPFGTKGGAASGAALARVGSAEIDEAAFLQTFDRSLRRVREQNPKVTAKDAVAQGAVDQVLDTMVVQAALDQFGGQTGLAISERAVDGEIASVPAFQNGGKFDQAIYQRLLRQQRLTEKDLRTDARGDLLRRQLITPVVLGARVPAKLAEPYAALLLAVRTGQVATVPAAAMPAPAVPSPAQLAAYYKANIARYTLPERRGFRYALLDGAALTTAVAVSDAEIAKYYESNRDALGGTEQRALLQVVVPTQAKAAAFVAAVKAGSSFAAEAAKLGFAATDIDLGVQNEAKFAAATSPAVAAAAFAAAQGAIASPVQSSFGWHIVEIARVVAPKVRSLADARADIVTKLRAQKGETALADTVAAIEDALGNHASFADVANKRGLKIVVAPPMTRDGRDPLNPTAPADPLTAPLAAKVFDADPADGATLQPLSKTQFALLEPGTVVAPAPRPLAQVQAEVTAQWTVDQRLAAAKRAADAVIAAVAKGTPFAAALAAQHLPPARPLQGRRIDVAQQQQRVPPPVQLFLTLPAGDTQAIPAGAAGFWVVHVDGIAAGNAAQLPAMAAATQAEFNKTAPDELAAVFARAVEKQVGSSRNAAAIDGVTRRILGQGTN